MWSECGYLQRNLGEWKESMWRMCMCKWLEMWMCRQECFLRNSEAWGLSSEEEGPSMQLSKWSQACQSVRLVARFWSSWKLQSVVCCVWACIKKRIAWNSHHKTCSRAWLSCAVSQTPSPGTSVSTSLKFVISCSPLNGITLGHLTSQHTCWSECLASV